ncbi:hypothetical protein [Catenulispora pinisilvae]|uniref:hypothetical protein n=1 Tax=Catenulispora pinisilvae TaxID=2705253 RepID=UPI001890FC8B|nr:hypothetical protein [Catenulispora pinisilvae]
MRAAEGGRQVGRWRGTLKADVIVPAVLVVLAIVTSLEPKVFGIELSERQIVLGFVAFLGVDALIERTGRLHRIEETLGELSRHIAGPVPAGRVLRTRGGFERMDLLAGHARRSVLIIGINLEGAVTALTAMLDLASAGGAVRLLAMDPNGVALAPSAEMAGVDPVIRRAKITQNLDLLKSAFDARLTTAARRRVSLQVVDRILPVGVTGIDVAARDGRLIVQHYLTRTAAEQAPLFDLRRDVDGAWFDRYETQCEASFDGPKEW